MILVGGSATGVGGPGGEEAPSRRVLLFFVEPRLELRCALGAGGVELATLRLLGGGPPGLLGVRGRILRVVVLGAAVPAATTVVVLFGSCVVVFVVAVVLGIPVVAGLPRDVQLARDHVHQPIEEGVVLK